MEPRNRFGGIEKILAGWYDKQSFVNLLSSLIIDIVQESIPSLAGRYDNHICRTSHIGYIGWQSRFLGIDSWAP